jgi:hypothetical protein
MDSRLARSLFLLCLGSNAFAAQGTTPAPAAEAPRGLKLHAAGAFEGYTLFAPLRSENIFLIDMNGDVVHRWKHGFPPLSNYLLDNGHVVCGSRNDDNPVFFGGGLAGRVRELDWDGSVVWEYQLSNEKRVFAPRHRADAEWPLARDRVGIPLARASDRARPRRQGGRQPDGGPTP